MLQTKFYVVSKFHRISTANGYGYVVSSFLEKRQGSYVVEDFICSKVLHCSYGENSTRGTVEVKPQTLHALEVNTPLGIMNSFFNFTIEKEMSIMAYYKKLAHINPMAF